MTTIRTSISPDLKHQSIKRGGLFGGAGAVLLLIAGTFFPLGVLKIWGIPIFAVGLLLIALGLAPYRKLCRQELCPNELQIDDHDLIFAKPKQPLLKIPLVSIEALEYVEKKSLYGLKIQLCKPSQEKISVLEPRFDIQSFVADSAQKFEGADLFLPYFSKRAIEKLKEAIIPLE